MSPGRPDERWHDASVSGSVRAGPALVSVALFAYIAVAIAADPRRRQGMAGRSTSSTCIPTRPRASAWPSWRGPRRAARPDPAARRTWWLLTAALGVYSVGNLLHSTYWLFGIDPFPSIGDVFFLGFYPLVFAAVLTVIRAAAVRVQWARLGLDTTILHAGLRRVLLVLRDRAHRRRPARPERAQVRAGAELHRAQLPHAAGLRRAADALRRHAHPAPGTDAAHARLLVDVPGRHRLGHVEGRRQLPSGRRLGRHLPVVLHLARGRRARAAARRARRRDAPRARSAAR